MTIFFIKNKAVERPDLSPVCPCEGAQSQTRGPGGSGQISGECQGLPRQVTQPHRRRWIFQGRIDVFRIVI